MQRLILSALQNVFPRLIARNAFHAADICSLTRTTRESIIIIAGSFKTSKLEFPSAVIYILLEIHDEIFRGQAIFIRNSLELKIQTDYTLYRSFLEFKNLLSRCSVV